jgi:hypothetical protein
MVPMDRQEFRVLGGRGSDVDRLERRVHPERGEPYVHGVEFADVRDVANAMEDAGGDGFTVESLAEACWGLGENGKPRFITRAATVLAFARCETSLIDMKYGRRNALVGVADDLIFEVIAFNHRVFVRDGGAA